MFENEFLLEQITNKKLRALRFGTKEKYWTNDIMTFD